MIPSLKPILIVASMMLASSPALSSCKIHIDSIEYAIIVPFVVRFNHRCGIDEMEKYGVRIGLNDIEKGKIISSLNSAKFFETKNQYMDGRLLIIAKRRKVTVKMLFDKKLDRVSCGSKIYNLINNGLSFSAVMGKLLDEKRAEIDLSYKEKTYKE